MRLFVAISPGPEVLARLLSEVDAMRRVAPSSKWVRGEGMHLTLAFLGERPAEEAPAIAAALAERVRSRAPFTLRFLGGGAFGRPGRPRVLWVGCEGDTEALRALHGDVRSALAPFEYEPDRETFSPHLTLARARDAGGDRTLARCAEMLADRDFGEARIEAVELFESRLSPAGASYTVVGRAPLAG